MIVDRYLAQNEVAVHGNPDAGPGARIAAFAGFRPGLGRSRRTPSWRVAWFAMIHHRLRRGSALLQPTAAASCSMIMKGFDPFSGAQVFVIMEIPPGERGCAERGTSNHIRRLRHAATQMLARSLSRPDAPQRPDAPR